MATRRSLLVGAAAASLGVSAARAAIPLKIGVLMPFSGMFALYGDEFARGYDLAADEVNSAGGINGGRRIELLRGDAGTPQQGMAAVQLLAGTQGVEAFIGTYLSAVAVVLGDAASQYDKLYWETNTPAPAVTERGLPNVIRSGPYVRNFSETTLAAFKELIAPALGKPLSSLKIFVEHDDSEYGMAHLRFHQPALAGTGATVITNAHSFKAIDFTDSVLRAKAANPDVWLTITYVPVNNLLLRGARDQGFSPPVIMTVGTGDTPETLQAVGAADLQGILVNGYPRPDQSENFGPGAGAFLAAYRKKYNRDPIAPQCMTAYVGAKMMFAAIDAAGSTQPDAVRAAVAKLDQPVGSYATGFGAKFDGNFQNTRASPTVVQWQDGKLVTVFPERARTDGTTVKNLPRK